MKQKNVVRKKCKERMADQENSGKEKNVKRMADQKFKKYGEAKKCVKKKC